MDLHTHLQYLFLRVNEPSYMLTLYLFLGVDGPCYTLKLDFLGVNGPCYTLTLVFLGVNGTYHTLILDVPRSEWTWIYPDIRSS